MASERYGEHGFRENCTGVYDPELKFCHDGVWHRGSGTVKRSVSPGGWPIFMGDLVIDMKELAHTWHLTGGLNNPTAVCPNGNKSSNWASKFHGKRLHACNH